VAKAAAPVSSPVPAALAALARASADAARGRGAPAWLARRREEAAERFEALGIPTPRDEEWKYTNAAPIAKPAWRRAPAVDAAAHAEELAALRLPTHGGVHLVFLNGRFAPEASSAPDVPGGYVGSLARALETDPASVEPHLARLADPRSRAFVALSTALVEDGAFVRLSRDTCLPVPIDVLYATVPGAEPAVSAPRTLIVAEAESRATVVERHVTLAGGAAGTGPTLSIPVTEVSLARNAVVEHLTWQEEADGAFHVATLDVRQDRDSRFTGHALTLGAALSRSETSVWLDAEGAEASLTGLYAVFGTRHADHHTRIDHARPHGISRQLYKGILDGKGTAVFSGKVIVHPNASKTDSRQANHNLLLSDDATVDTKPQLEIFNDDVQCAHGATVGRLADDEVFYLRSRGIPEGAARDLLVRAFVRDVTERISVEAIRARLERWMTDRLPALGGREDAP
jgi:Fe-S cluster assembly protein SufD